MREIYILSHLYFNKLVSMKIPGFLVRVLFFVFWLVRVLTLKTTGKRIFDCNVVERDFLHVLRLQHKWMNPMDGQVVVVDEPNSDFNRLIYVCGVFNHSIYTCSFTLAWTIHILEYKHTTYFLLGLERERERDG